MGFFRLQDIEALFLDFLELVFHPDHDPLDVGVVRFGSGGVYLPSHFLCDEAQFLAWLRIRVYRIHKIAAVLAQPYFLFIDVEFFYLLYHLLFQTALVRFQLELLETAQDLLPDGFGALFLMGLHLVHV